MAKSMSYPDMVDELVKGVQTIRMSAGKPALWKNGNLARAAQLVAWQLQSGVAEIEKADKDALELAQDAWYTGDRAFALVGEGSIDTNDYPAEWNEDEPTRKIVLGDWNEIGAGIGGGPFQLFAIVFLGHRDNAPGTGELVGKQFEVALSEDLSFYDPKFASGKLQF